MCCCAWSRGWRARSTVVARAALIRAGEQRLDERSSHPLRGDAWTLRDLLLSQSRQLAQVIEGARPADEPVAL